MTEISVGDRAAAPGTGTTDGGVPTFGELFDAHHHPLVRLAALLGADDPEDIAQEAFVRLYRRRRRLRDPGASYGYLRTTVINLTRNRRRHLRIAGLRLAALRDRAVADREAPAEFIAMVREDHRELLEGLDRLPARQREVLVLRYWLDLSEREICEVLGVSAGTVKSHAHRGIAALKLVLGERS